MSQNTGLSSTEDLFDVRGLVAVVTGGGSGIGLMMAKALENNGAVVYIVSRQLDKLEDAAKKHNRYGNLIPHQCDISSQDSILSLVESVKNRHGYINLLINNAGVALNLLPKLPKPTTTSSSSPESPSLSFTSDQLKSYQTALWKSSSPQDFSKTFEVNTSAVWYTTIAFLSLLDLGNRKGNMKGLTSQVITISSGGGFRKDESVFSVSYTLSKAATTHLGKMLAHFLKDWQIRSNVIAPGIFPSRMTDGVITPAVVQKGVPMKREGGLDDIAGLILFLASRAGAYVNGSVHLIDGGRLTLFPSTY